MNNMQEDPELMKAIKFVDELTLSLKGRHLSEPEIAVICGGWYGQSYGEMARRSTYAEKYLQHTVAPDLWELLSEVLGNGGRVWKKNLREFLEKLVQQGTRKILVRLLGEPPVVSCFYGREAELALLKAAIIQKRLVYVFGEPGIGKSALVAKLLTTEISQEFDLLIWKSVAHSPSIEELAASLHKMLNSPRQSQHASQDNRLSPEQTSVSSLKAQLRERSCLLILDGLVEANYKQRIEYIRFLVSLIEELDEIRLILTSRESLTEINALSNSRPVSSIQIEGLDVRAGIQIFRDKGLKIEQESAQIVELIRHYRGNPLELESVANRINYLFGGDLNKFWEYKTTFISEYLQNVLHEIFAQPDLLSSLQKEILIYVAEKLSKKTESIKFSDLLDFFVKNLGASASKLITALEDLERRQLIKVIKDSLKSEAYYTLAPGVKKYVLSDPLRLVHQEPNT
ncbi:NB-ARC domain-containing protein [Fischerella thermalis]|uniref:ATP-binding protein n=1 Tax=Fischerella thermalis CCMEE 5318 TaxID=2019666 RepID=A0A2N6L565_9CYAN|nr:ATP-binding protein [Fischerella thermalis]PMB16296.1 ATP-binding protein [Fischerella thermalis CCMEE 5318]